MKYVVEIMAVYEIEAGDMREAQKQGYLKAKDIYDKDVDCVQTQVYSLSDQAVYYRHKDII